MPFPVTYFTQDGLPIENAAQSEEAFFAACAVLEAAEGSPRAQVAAVLRSLSESGFAISRIEPPFAGQIARVQIDSYGETAGEVEATLLNYAGRCDAASQASEVAYGRCVIERNLEEEWGATYSWRGRLVLHPTIGTIPSSERAAAAIGEMLDRDPR